MQKLISQLSESYRLAALFCLAALPLFCIPVFFEALQHFAELLLGMFAVDRTELFTAEDQNIRLIFGVIKVLSISAMFLFVPRFYIHGLSVKSAVSLTPRAKRSVWLGVALMVAIVAWVFLAGPQLVEMFIAGATAKQKLVFPLIAILVLGIPIQKHMNAWMVQTFDDTPLRDGENVALIKAFKGGLSPVFIFSILPLMVVHYALNIWAFEKPLFSLMPMLGLDSLVVGLLAVLMGTSTYVLYRDARSEV